MTYTICPYRFTDRAHQVSACYQLIGLRPVLSEPKGFVIPEGASGRVALHPRATAQHPQPLSTSLCFDVPDARAAAIDLARLGLTTQWWDEAFGRQASVDSPFGTLVLNEEMTDTHGYEVIEAASSPVQVIATLYTSDTGDVAKFLAQLGFLPFGEESAGWLPLRGVSGAGLIALFEVSADDERDGSVEIGFETSEPLEALKSRLDQAGYGVFSDTTDDDYAPHLTLIDPDGQRAVVNISSP